MTYPDTPPPTPPPDLSIPPSLTHSYKNTFAPSPSSLLLVFNLFFIFVTLSILNRPQETVTCSSFFLTFPLLHYRWQLVLPLPFPPKKKTRAQRSGHHSRTSIPRTSGDGWVVSFNMCPLSTQQWKAIGCQSGVTASLAGASGCEDSAVRSADWRDIPSNCTPPNSIFPDIEIVKNDVFYTLRPHCQEGLMTPWTASFCL